jgi:septal ring factor EnvC (AmiA/AmiB activator)
MKTTIAIPIIAVLVIALVAVGFLDFQNMSNLNAAEDKIAEHEATIASLQSDLSTSRAEATDLRSKLTASEAEVSSLKGKVAGLETDKAGLESSLASTKSQLAQKTTDLTAAQTVNTTLTAELKKIKDPRHFSSVTELTDWLQKDDTNTKYASLKTGSANYVQMSFILQVRAARDGYILPVYFIFGSTSTWVSNYAIIGDTMYLVEAGDDSVTAYYRLWAVPSHPEPLP